MSLVDPARPDAPMSPAAPAASRTTVVVSLAAHVVGVTLVVVVPLFGQTDLPAPSRHIGAFVKAAVPARPVSTTRAVTSASTTVAAPSSAAAPTEAPTGIASGEAPPMMQGVTAGSSLGAADGTALFGYRPSVGEPPAPPTPSPKPLRVGGSIQAPRKLRHVAPVYPQIAQQARVTGTVILEAVLSPTGEVSNVKVLRSVPLLDAAAVDAVAQWRYAPTLLNGTPVSVLMTVTVRVEQ